MNLRENLKGNWYKLGLVLIFITVLLVYAFSQLSFGLRQSKTSVNINAETFSVMEPKFNPDEILYLHVVQDNAISRKLEVELKKRLEAEGWQVRSFLNLKDRFEGPVLAVKILRKELGYLPLYTNSQLDVLVYFASNGRTDYFEQFVREEFGGSRAVVQFNSSQGPQLIDKGVLNARDSSYGLFSLPSYHNYLARALATKIEAELEQIASKY